MENGDNLYLDSFYKTKDEDIRFLDKGQYVEFATTMRYIQKFLKPNSKILELGAATGAYSIPLAQMGHDVTSVELLDCNLNVLKKKAKKIKNITPVKANALDLSQFKDNTFDMVLSLGPMYHLYTKKDDLKAIKEAIRVCKKGGVMFFAYITNSATVFRVGVIKNDFKCFDGILKKDGSIINTPQGVFSCHFTEEFNSYFKNLNVQKITEVAADGLADIFKKIMADLSKDDYERFLNWHFSTCERKDQLGWSSHVLYICKKK